VTRSTASLPTMSRNVIAPSRGITTTPQPRNTRSIFAFAISMCDSSWFTPASVRA
jgi:hypothetical protein